MGVRKERFPLAAVLTVANGLPEGLISTLGDVQRLLSFMVGHELYVPQMPRAADVCRKYLTDQFGWLASMQPTDCRDDKVKQWGRAAAKRWGDEVLVEACPGDVYSPMEPMVEFGRLFGSKKAGAR
ncbi:Uncharacterised protein [Mycobacteroides abscessus subsp. massiliense]|uniref:DUF7736 domain-containing protein n=1 Tax=Mycobacteroides abscessus TaxID=36809 RepID=UPI0009A7DFC0|nr:hypothetical protein [Mycobacteroides abscessus]SKM82296.1 Uncharacterised protein [Mycobacteroides abscessus subsp. massiliense]SKM98983.1 Uncharacterised protein [Mycobacteroides abscessus subsp. massiliense]SKN77584.1 Uncharacterised protein [Mycobacteroides abscessus subsp. massiliense]SKN95606.1 Uncharacterised protein [Mycobacteroides abscessus subsp. massiliense]SKO22866.1 Uncharacterised protein [Mycobacteroides abscessus subsp. massiliense]